MMYKIKAVLKSPLMIGGKTLNSNYRKSRDYVPGSVLRAAYAKALIQRCAYEQKNYWLAYKSQSKCEVCEFRTVCKNFAEIAFPVLYPMDGSPYPVTAREKKYKDKGEKSVVDILRSRLVTERKIDRESDWESLQGIQKDGETIKLIHSAITRTAIDYRRNAAKDGSLYTQNVISEKYPVGNNDFTDIIFSGVIKLTPEEKSEFDKIGMLYIGADITRGFGKCYMSLEEKKDDDTPEKIKERIYEFNSGIVGEKCFVVLDLLTDAYLGMEEAGKDSSSQAEIPDSEMLEFLEQRIGLPRKRYHLFKVFKLQEIFRGFDTSKATEKEMRRRGRLVVKAGAVFVYQVMRKEIDEKELFELEERGIGEHVKHGFGRIRICDMFHMEYDVLRGKV